MKKMKKLKRKLLEQIKTSGGLPPKASDRTFEEQRKQFQRVEESIGKLQQASVAWAGALDAFSACSQALAEEMARHTMLLAENDNSTMDKRPAEQLSCSPSSSSSSSSSSSTDTAKMWQALQKMISSVDDVFTRVYHVFLEAHLRPLLETQNNELRDLHGHLDERAEKLASYRALNKNHSNDNDATVGVDCADTTTIPDWVAGNMSSVKSKRGRIELAQRTLQESTDKCLYRLARFHEEQVRSMPEQIGSLLGCYYSMVQRLSADMESLLPAFPQAACVIVDISNGTNTVQLRNERRQRTRAEFEITRKQQEDACKRIRRHQVITVGSPGNHHGSGKSAGGSAMTSGKWRVSMNVNGPAVVCLAPSSSSASFSSQSPSRPPARAPEPRARPPAPGMAPLNAHPHPPAPKATKHTESTASSPPKVSSLPASPPAGTRRKSLAKRFSLARGFGGGGAVKSGTTSRIEVSSPLGASRRAQSFAEARDMETRQKESEDYLTPASDSNSEAGTPVHSSDTDDFNSDGEGEPSPPPVLNLGDSLRREYHGGDAVNDQDRDHSWSSKMSGGASAIYALEYGSETGSISSPMSASENVGNDGDDDDDDTNNKSKYNTSQEITTQAQASPPPIPSRKKRASVMFRTSQALSSKMAAAAAAATSARHSLSSSPTKTNSITSLSNENENLNNVPQPPALSSSENQGGSSIGFATLHEQFRIQ